MLICDFKGNQGTPPFEGPLKKIHARGEVQEGSGVLGQAALRAGPAGAEWPKFRISARSRGCYVGLPF